MNTIWERGMAMQHSWEGINRKQDPQDSSEVLFYKFMGCVAKLRNLWSTRNRNKVLWWLFLSLWMTGHWTGLMIAILASFHDNQKNYTKNNLQHMAWGQLVPPKKDVFLECLFLKIKNYANYQFWGMHYQQGQYYQGGKIGSCRAKRDRICTG